MLLALPNHLILYLRKSHLHAFGVQEDNFDEVFTPGDTLHFEDTRYSRTDTHGVWRSLYLPEQQCVVGVQLAISGDVEPPAERILSASNVRRIREGLYDVLLVPCETYCYGEFERGCVVVRDFELWTADPDKSILCIGFFSWGKPDLPSHDGLLA